MKENTYLFEKNRIRTTQLDETVKIVTFIKDKAVIKTIPFRELKINDNILINNSYSFIVSSEPYFDEFNFLCVNGE